MDAPLPVAERSRRSAPPQPGVTDDDLAFARDFERCRVAADAFHHEDHVRLAWICLRQAPLAEAAPRFIRLLRAFAAHQGADRLYHETITWAYLLLIQDRLTEMPQRHDWADLAERNPDLLAYRPSILPRYYREETLASERARRGFVMPDAWLDAPAAAAGLGRDSASGKPMGRAPAAVTPRRSSGG